MEIIGHVKDWIEHLLFSAMLTYGYWAIFFGVMLENAGLPVPGETILIIGGVFAANGHFSLWKVMLVAACGAVIGDNIGFAVGRRFGRGFLLTVGRFVFLTPRRIVRIGRFFKSHGDKTILVARFITGLRVFAAIFAGASGMRWSVFLFYNICGAIIWSVAISTLGYIFGESWHILEKWVGRTGVILLGAAAVALIIAIKLRSRRKARKPETRAHAQE